MPLMSVGRTQICYETYGEKSNPALILIGGLGWQLTAWDVAFCNQCVDAGFFVVRFDDRDAGLSSWFSRQGLPDIPAVVEDVRNKLQPNIPYTLDDMAADVVGLIDELRLKGITRREYLIYKSQACL